jgi:type II secretory pathway pseudopilin PulG
LIELLAVISIVAILISILLPALAKARELANRAVCMANIRGIIRSMVTYGQSNNGMFPAPGVSNNWYWFSDPPTAPISFLASGTNSTSGAMTAQLWYEYPSVQPGNPPNNSGTPPEPTAGMWISALEGYTTPASFICPSDPLAAGPSLEYFTNAGILEYNPNFGETSPQTAIYGSSHNHGKGLSYSVAFLWPRGLGTQINPRPGQWWNSDYASTQVPLVSDMAPIDDSDGDTTGAYQRITTTLPTANTYGPYIYNSGNHAGDGQNVGFGDDHVTWETSPYVGENGDNIFTYTTATGVVNGTTDTNQAGLADVYWGTVTTPLINTLAAPFDTCMTPARTVNPATAANDHAWY